MAKLRGMFSRLRRAETLSAEQRADQAFERKDFATAILLTRQAAEAGAPDAMFRMGEVFEYGLGALQDFAEAARWYETAADAGLLAGAAKLGEFYLVGRGVRAEAALADPDAPNAESSRQGFGAILKSMSVAPDPTRAAHWNRKASDDGDPEAQARLAIQHVYGLGVSKDWEEAERLFLLAAGQDSAAAQRGLGMLYAGGEAGAPRYDRAEHWFRKAADQGDVGAQAALAFLILDGKALTTDGAEAFDLLMAAAEGDHVEAMLGLGNLYRLGKGIDVDVSAAETWYRRASVRGHLQATLALGFLLITALASPDYISAALAFREAADRGNATGQYMMGKLHLGGLGVPQDDARAAEYFGKAADQGLKEALEALAAMQVSGRGVDQDLGVATELFERAAQAGSIDALYHRANIALAGGIGLAANRSAAIAMLKEAAEQRNAPACLQLGVLHAQGEVVPQDYGEAARWYRRAADEGLSDGLVNLAFVRLRGLDPAPDGRDGIELLEEAVAAGNHTALWALHNIHAEGSYVKADPAEAQRWLVAAATAGSAAAACRLAEQLDSSSDQAEPGADEVLAWLKAAAETGDADAAASYGRILYEGRHVAADAEGAFRHLNLAARNGSAFAQAWMGDVLREGKGVLKDEALARAWYEKAARQGHVGAAQALTAMVLQPEAGPADKAEIFAIWLAIAEAGEPMAQRIVGEYYLRGMGVAPATDEAERWLRAAAEANQVGALLLLGGMIVQGQATSRQPDEAVQLYERAAAQGSVDAEYNLGVCYRRGIGVPVDLEKARARFIAAAQSNYQPARIALEDL